MWRQSLALFVPVFSVFILNTDFSKHPVLFYTIMSLGIGGCIWAIVEDFYSTIKQIKSSGE